MKYFHDCKTKEEAKHKYRELAKKLHPDKGGSSEQMIDLQEQFESFDEPTVFKETFSGSEHAFRESIYDKYRAQNKDAPYFKFYGQSSVNNGGELQRLRDENTKMRGQLYQYEFQIKSIKETSEVYYKGMREREIKILQLQQIIEERNEQIMTSILEIDRLKNRPKTIWESIRETYNNFRGRDEK